MQTLDNQIAFTSQNSRIANYRANRTKEQKDAEKKVVTGGGAIAATTTAARAKAMKSGVGIFSSSKSATAGIKNMTTTAKVAQKATKQAGSLWVKVCENAKWAKDSIIKWGTKFKTNRFVKPLIESRVFKGCAGILGYGFGVITLISGLSDIGRVATETAENLTK